MTAGRRRAKLISTAEHAGAARPGAGRAAVLTTPFGPAAPPKEDPQMESADPVGMLIALALVYLATLRWGADSGDGPDSPKWERRRGWRGLRGRDRRRE